MSADSAVDVSAESAAPTNSSGLSDSGESQAEQTMMRPVFGSATSRLVTCIGTEMNDLHAEVNGMIDATKLRSNDGSNNENDPMGGVLMSPDDPFRYCPSLLFPLASLLGGPPPVKPDGAHASSDMVASRNAAHSVREVGDEAVWSLSSAKVGNGVEQLGDGDTNTFWQSDGQLPHSITIHFPRKTRLSSICFFVDQKGDESYCPCRISIRVGSGSSASAVAAASCMGLDGSQRSSSLAASNALPADVREVDRFELEEPQGWVVCHLDRAAHKEDVLTSTKPHPIRCAWIQIAVLASYQNGRDTRVRQVKVFGPKQWNHRGVLDDMLQMSSVDMQQFAQIR